MMNQQPALTVDSLVKFSHKKKFSFAKRNIAPDEDDLSDKSESNNLNESNSDDDNNHLKSSKKNLNVNRQPKGSAMLKKDDSTTDSETSDSDNEKKSKKNNKKHKSSKNDEDNDSKNEKHFKKLVNLFPTYSKEEIKRIWTKKKFNSKKCIDYLLKEKENNKKRLSSSNSSNSIVEEIEEWSDGDPEIRAKNAQNKIKRDDLKMNGEAHKRKLNNKDPIVKEPLKKKFKKFIVDSDEDEENTNSKKSSSSSLSSSASSTSSQESIDEDKPKKKKSYKVQSSDDEVVQNVKKSKSKKVKKDKKKKNKKNKKAQYDSEFEDVAGNSDDEDNLFNKSDAENGSTDSDDGDNLSDGEKAAILSLFSEASVEEIMSMINITKKKIETLLALRPFSNFKDLETKLCESKLTNVINQAKSVIYARSIVTNLLTKCEKISKKMEDQVAELIESNETGTGSISSKSNKLELKTQPKNLNPNLSLKPYQLIGLNWLCLLHKENINGILADEMGLGKTCQTISFLAHLFETNPKFMHLIVVPPSTLDNWVREISTWCPTFNFTVYQGSPDERRHLRSDILNNRFEKPLNAILTTYGMLSSSNEDKAFFRKLKIEYCVYDEAHMLKNMNSIRYQSLIKINSRKRLLLTGTPLQNNLVELMSLLYFVMPDIFQHKTEHLKKIFETKPIDVDKDTYYNQKIVQAKGIMKPFIMRRLKNDVLKQLPAKIEKVIHCKMTIRQMEEYDKLITMFRIKKQADAESKIEAKTLQKQKKGSGLIQNIVEECNELKNLNTKSGAGADDASSKISHIIMELRKAANHPLLRRCIYDDDKLKKMAKLVLRESSADTVYEYVLEDMSVMSDFQLHKLCFLYKCLKGHELSNDQILESGKFEALDKLLTEKIEAGSRILIFSQFVIMLDILEEFLKIKSYKYCRLDGTTAISDRQDLIDEYNDKDSGIFVFLLSTRAGGMGINLTAANVVVMHDIDYNPFNDKQAEDRCHRVGQTKEVEVYKLISKDSIDEQMLNIQKRKLELGEDISGEKEEIASKADMVSMLNEALKIK